MVKNDHVLNHSICKYFETHFGVLCLFLPNVYYFNILHYCEHFSNILDIVFKIRSRNSYSDSKRSKYYAKRFNFKLSKF